MARCKVGPKKVKKLADETGLPVVKALVRGGTDHRVDLCLADGRVVHRSKHGQIEDWGMKWARNTE